jgi:hypothetical protein
MGREGMDDEEVRETENPKINGENIMHPLTLE